MFFMWSVWEKNKEKIRFAGAAIGLFLVFRFVVPLIYPFIIGALLAVALRPLILYVHRKIHIGKGICALLFLMLLFLLGVFILGFCGYSLIEKGYLLLEEYETYATVMEEKAGVCCDWIETQLHLRSGYLMEEMRGAVTKMSGNWQTELVPGIFERSLGGMKLLFSAGAFFVFVTLSVVLLTKEWDGIKQGPWSGYQKYADRVLEFLKIFLGAQMKIISVIALICLVGFWLAGIKRSLGLALLTACLDLLPFIGTGIVIVPMLLWKMLNAEYYQACLLLATYICCIIAREYLEPRFISAKTGISPLATLVSIYVGVRIIGFSGIFLGPLYVLLLYFFYEEFRADQTIGLERE